MISFGSNLPDCSARGHWNKIYAKTPSEQLGWYEKESRISIQLIEKSQLSHDAVQFHAGAGSSTLLPLLCENGFKHFVINDISDQAIKEMKKCMAGCKAEQVYLCHDLTDENIREHIPDVDLWYDRAVFHFFTHDKDVRVYFDTIQEKVKSGGYVILAAFHKSTVSKCSGLNVRRYDADEIAKNMGDSFEILYSGLEKYTQPSGGERIFVYTLFRKK